MKIRNRTHPKTLVFYLLLCAMLTGCSSAPKNPDDPWENWNRSTQEFNDDFDQVILEPLAKGYLFSTPEPIDKGITNFFSNIDDISVSINDLLQFKMLQAGSDFSRFLINSTVGVAGFIDVASMIGLPKHNEDFEQTLGVWGVPSGPYLVIPLWGSSSPRGVAGSIGDALMDPLNYAFLAGFGASVASTASDVLDVTDKRAGLMTTSKIVNEASIDRYNFIKESYRQHREYLITDGKSEELEDLFDTDLDFDEPNEYQLQLSPLP